MQASNPHQIRLSICRKFRRWLGPTAAIRLGTAAFPENGQKRLVLLTDGNENIGDAMGAVLAATHLKVSVDVVPLGVSRANDVSVERLQVPSKLKKGQAF